MEKNRHKTKFIVGDRVVLINLPRYIGTKGVVEKISGLINEKYSIRLDDGRLTVPIATRYLAKDKRNN